MTAKTAQKYFWPSQPASMAFPPSLGIARGYRTNNTTLQSMLAVLKRRHSITNAVFVFGYRMSSRLKLGRYQQTTGPRSARKSFVHEQQRAALKMMLFSDHQKFARFTSPSTQQN
jgi:hypothetical protein